MKFCRHRERHRIHLADHVVIIDERPRSGGGRDFLGARAVRVDDGDEIHACERRQNPRVMAAQVSHADDGYA